MFKTMIAAAALAVAAVPTVAVAGGTYAQQIKLLKEIKAAKNDKLTKLKLEWKAGNTNLTRAQYRAKLAQIRAAIARVEAHLQRIRDKKASA